ncbi:MAG: DUF459 domain-containing protein [Acidimicrobiales bacterium]
MSSLWRAGALTALAVVIVVAGIIGGLSASTASDSASGTAPTTTPTSTSTPGGSVPDSSLPNTTTTTTAPAPPRLDDGSLGDQAPRIACTLLSASQIQKVFHAPVPAGVPVYPYCQWLVGRSTWLALEVEPDTPFNVATAYVATMQTIPGLGQEAIVANDHVLYFTSGSTAYAISVQTPPNFEAEYDVSELTTLAHDVLAHGLPSGKIGIAPQPPAGPPIYFAGGSTAAGPEWAFWQYYTDQNTNQATKGLFEYFVGSGFVHPQFFDWPKHLLAMVAARRPKLVIFMGGANDGQAMTVDGKYAAVGSPLWTAQYKEIIGSTMASLVKEGCKVLWIGEPAMQSAYLSAYMRDVDSVYAEEAKANPGVTYVDPGWWLDGPHGTYTGEVKINGQETSVFLDGIHLNTVGSQYLAGYIAKYVDRILGLKTH